MKKIILCADDFGLRPGVNRAILDLASKGRLSATTVMTTSPLLESDRKTLAAHSLDLGLHFDLTEFPPLTGKSPVPGPVSLRKLLLASWSNTLRQDVVAAELQAQMNKFRDLFGSWPRFLDGHEHVHQLSGVRQAALAQAKKHRMVLRCGDDTLNRIFARRTAISKSIAIGFMGRRLRNEAVRRQVRVNSAFSGLYDFSQGLQYEKLFRRFTSNIVPGTLIVCHPGVAEPVADPIGPQREAEYRFFSSDAFEQTLVESGVVVGRWY